MVLTRAMLDALSDAGVSLKDEERRRYIKTTIPLGKGSFGKVREAYRSVLENSQQHRSRSSAEDSFLCNDSEIRMAQMDESHGPNNSLLDDNFFQNGLYIRVAIKEIDLSSIKDQVELARYIRGVIREAKVLRKVRGAKHLITSYTPWYNPKRNRLCFPMEMATMNLEQYFVEQWKMQPPKGYLFAICEQILLAVDELHTLRIAHRDVKMNNFLIFLSDDVHRVPTIKLADFGLSVLADELPLDNRIVGTPYFMAPECWDRHREKHFDDQSVQTLFREASGGAEKLFATDLWAVGCILFLLANRKLPFTASNHKDLRKNVLEGEIVKNLSSEDDNYDERAILDYLARRCLEKDPLQRPTAHQLRNLFNAEHQKHSCNGRLVKLPERRGQEEQGRSYMKPMRHHFYQLMLVCRENCPVSIYPLSVLQPIEERVERTPFTRVLSNPLVAPLCTLHFGNFVLTYGKFYVYNALSSKGVQWWVKVVYPYLGCCSLEECGHHVLHPFSCRFRRACPPLEEKQTLLL